MRSQSRSSRLGSCRIAFLGTKRCLEAKKRDQEGMIREPGEKHVSDPREGERSLEKFHRSIVKNIGSTIRI